MLSSKESTFSLPVAPYWEISLCSGDGVLGGVADLEVLVDGQLSTSRSVTVAADEYNGEGVLTRLVVEASSFPTYLFNFFTHDWRSTV